MSIEGFLVYALVGSMLYEYLRCFYLVITGQDE